MDRSLKAMLPTSSLYLLLAIAIVSYLVGYLAAQTRFPTTRIAMVVFRLDNPLKI